MFMNNRRITVDELASFVNIFMGSVHTVLREDIVLNISECWVTRILTQDKKGASFNTHEAE